jgi:hypothetical protein
MRIGRRAFREEVYSHYGNACACCGETRYAFLTIDHVDNDGKRHRQEIGGDALALCRWLRDRDYPKDGFQILCRNCNYAKFSQGVCPHEQERLDARTEETGHA